MKHGRLIIAALVGAMLITSLAGCGSKGTNDGESGEYQKINLSMAVNGTDTQIDSLVARHFADLVSERSGGNIVIDVFSNDTLAGGNSTKTFIEELLVELWGISGMRENDTFDEMQRKLSAVVNVVKKNIQQKLDTEQWHSTLNSIIDFFGIGNIKAKFPAYKQ